MKTDKQNEDEYFSKKIHINGKFMDDHKFDIDGSIKYDFAFFHGTMFEFDSLLIKHKDIVDKYRLEYRYLSEDEIRLSKLPVPIFRNEITKRNEAYRYLRSGYNSSTTSYKSY